MSRASIYLVVPENSMGEAPGHNLLLYLLLVNDGDPMQEILADSASPSDAHLRKIVQQREGGEQIVHVHLTSLWQVCLNKKVKNIQNLQYTSYLLNNNLF
jgi:hypothetical protein